jgi:hypothetical protein
MDAWMNMIVRCTRPNAQHYRRYGGRGIAVCQRWLDDFGNFLMDMGRRPAGMTLERIDNDKDYCPENCRWATRKEQQNNRSSNRIISAKGRQLTVAQWCADVGINRNTLVKRLNAGWEPERALFHPVKKETARQEVRDEGSI